MLQIVWKQKHQSGHGTCDKKILTPPSIRMCPHFYELKKGDFFTPLPPVWTNRGEGEIEKVFVLDAHGFIRQ